MVEKTKRPNPVDIHVGSRVRLRRTLLGVSQEKLGEKLGITFQQVQKYEKGSNRIGASRLQNIAEVLSAPVSFFFEGMNEEAPAGTGGLMEAPAEYVADFAASTEGVALSRAFARIPDPKVRRRILDLVRTLADVGEGIGAGADRD